MLEYYVINYDSNSRKIYQFNIFRNWVLEEAVIKEIKKYLRNPSKYKHVKRWRDESDIYGFDGLCAEIRSLIMWQEWSRCEYEILVGSLFADSLDDMEKIDCYWQCEKNIACITRECIWQYKHKKESDSDAV